MGNEKARKMTVSSWLRGERWPRLPSCRHPGERRKVATGTLSWSHTGRQWDWPACRLALVALLGLAAMLLLTACVERGAKLGTHAKPPEQVRVLLMPPDVELSELTAGGLEEPKAAWSEAATRHVVKALRKSLRGRQDTLVVYRPPEEGSADWHDYTQLMKLSDAVSSSVMLHGYVPGLSLPTKDEKLDWTLGSGVEVLRRTHAADYALFVFLRDSYATGGRRAYMFVSALFGVYVPGGTQVGYASLADLRTGELVWFNMLTRKEGDLRTPEAADEAAEALLEGLPL